MADQQAIVDKIGYTLANPVAAGAVRNASKWPGFRSRIADMDGHEVEYTRPTKYFSPHGTMAESLSNVRTPDRSLVFNVMSRAEAGIGAEDAASERASGYKRQAEQ